MMTTNQASFLRSFIDLGHLFVPYFCRVLQNPYFWTNFWANFQEYAPCHYFIQSYMLTYRYKPAQRMEDKYLYPI